MFVYDNDLLAQWIGFQLGRQFHPPYQCIGVVRGEDLVAAALFNNYDHPNIEITFVTTSPRWASRQAVARILGYPFIELGCRRITAVTGKKNRRTRDFLGRLGFAEEGYHRELFERDDGVSYGLLKRDAEKWLESYHVKGTIPACSTGPLHDGRGGSEIQHSDRHRERPPE